MVISWPRTVMRKVLLLVVFVLPILLFASAKAFLQAYSRYEGKGANATRVTEMEAVRTIECAVKCQSLSKCDGFLVTSEDEQLCWILQGTNGLYDDSTTSLYIKPGAFF